jgi:aryl-alcohol dehydrogenase-like predicted oxidoreductase
MRYILFGRSGLKVSEMGLGAMNFGGSQVSEADARKIFDLYAEAGGNFIDTACIYTAGASEKVVGELVKSDRDHFVVCTKYGLSGPASVSRAGNNRKNMRRSVEESLQRLGTDAIDVLYVHMWDFTTGWDEILTGLDAIVRSGKAHYIAISDTPAWEISRAVTISELRGWAPFVGQQLRYSLADRTAERDLLPMTRELDLGVTAWSPLAGGVLTGQHDPVPGDSARRISVPAGLASLVREIALELECTQGQLALAWIRAQEPRLGPIIPLVAADSPEQMVQNLGYLDVRLEPEQLRRLERLTATDPGFPHSILTGDDFLNLTTAFNPTQLDNHRLRKVDVS